jgi:hypothetical protein
LEVFALQVDLRAGQRRQPITELQGGLGDDARDSLGSRIDVGRRQG